MVSNLLIFFLFLSYLIWKYKNFQNFLQRLTNAVKTMNCLPSWPDTQNNVPYAIRLAIYTISSLFIFCNIFIFIAKIKLFCLFVQCYVFYFCYRPSQQVPKIKNQCTILILICTRTNGADYDRAARKKFALYKINSQNLRYLNIPK